MDQEIDMNEKIFPIIGPSSEAEAIESINKFEENLKNGQVHWTSSEEFDRQLFARNKNFIHSKTTKI